MNGKSTGLVLDVASQVGGPQPGTVTLLDKSRFKNNGTMTNVTWTRLPSGLWVMNFNGATSKVDCGSNSSLKTQNLSISLWVRMNDFVGVQYILGNCQRNVIVNGFGLTFNGTSLQLGVCDAAASDFLARVVPSGNRFYHFSVTVGTVLVIYVDGWASGVSAARTKTMVFPNNLFIGYAPAGTAYQLDGQIGLAKIYNYALTPAQIRNIYARERGYFGV